VNERTKWRSADGIRLPLLVGAVLSGAVPSDATTLHVPSEYPTINEALDWAASGDTVLVAAGTYTTAEVRNVDLGSGFLFPIVSLVFLKDGVVVKSEAGPQVTVLDLQGQIAFEGYAVIAGFLPSTTTTLDGFTVTGSPVGYSGMVISECGTVTVRDCVFRDLDSRGVLGVGGGITSGFSNLVIEGTTFRNCVSDQGGGVWVYEGDGSGRGDVVVDGCTFENCSQRALDIEGDSLVPQATATITDCVFRGNTSNVGAGALLVADYVVTVEGSSFIDNFASSSGGGAAVFSVCNFSVRDCLFVRNGCGPGNGVGGAINGGPPLGGSATIEGCTFYANSQQWTFSGGAAIRLSANAAASCRLANNIISSSGGAAAIHYTGLILSTLTTSCNVFWDNTAGDVQGLALDSTDRVVDPMFCDVALDDFTLHEASPCLPANSLGCGQIGAFGQGCGTVSLQPTTWAKIKAMYR
jgi:hypothetical protein